MIGWQNNGKVLNFVARSEKKIRMQQTEPRAEVAHMCSISILPGNRKVYNNNKVPLVFLTVLTNFGKIDRQKIFSIPVSFHSSLEIQEEL